MGNKATLTQQEELAQKLMALKPEVTDQDKEELSKEHNISKSTIYAYLNGKVLNIQTGVTILSFFKQKVQQRRELISNL